MDVTLLRRSVFNASQQLWMASPWAEYCLRLGVGSPTSLLTDLPGGPPELAPIRQWLPAYRRESWARGLEAQRVPPPAREDAGPRLDAAFRAQQRTFCPPYPDAVYAVERASREHRLALTTNGPGDVQRAKLRVSGLSRFFPVVVVSAEIGSGKPESPMFRSALDRLGVRADEAVVVGDSVERDIAGAVGVGIVSVLVDRSRAPAPRDSGANVTIATLADLPSALATLSAS